MPVIRAKVNRTEQSAFLGGLEDVIAASLLGPEPVGLLLVELRDLERLNTSLGYKVGDEVVVEVAGRLASGFAEQGRVVRVGAGRFAIVFQRIKSSAHALLAAKKVERLAAEPLEIEGHLVAVDVDQGMALWPEHAGSGEELLQRAEIALADARGSERSIVMYSPTRLEALRRSLRVESALKAALQDGGIEPHFQPQIELSTGEPCGAEALLRCRDLDGAFLPPEDVVRVAERTGQLARLTSIMLNAALRHAADWPAGLSARRVAVNASTQSLTGPELVESVVSALKIWDARPEDLTIEVTESALMVEPDKSFSTLRRLRALGVRVSIDDFGTGYSSLSYFKNIPANELKVDKAFVTNMVADAVDRKIVRVVTELAHAFDLEIVAEGVEDEATVDLLREMGCDLVQGYRYGRPMPAADFLAWLAGRVPRAAAV